MKIRRTGVLFLSLVISAALGGCAGKETVPAQGDAVTQVISQAAETQTSAEIDESEPHKAHFLAVGDNLIHDTVYKQALKRGNGMDYDFTYAYANVADRVKAADISVINQETLICGGDYEPSSYPYFNSPPELGDHMLYIGFDVFTIANNHVLDKGEDGLRACLDYWDDRPEAVVAGVYRGKADKRDIRTFEANGIVFSILAYTENLNGMSLPENSPFIIGNAYDFDGIAEDIKRAKEISDMCVVALHWGVENSPEISRTQLDVSQRFADAGADIIIGNHPHVLRDVRMIDRKDGGKTLCAYSLGNFISAQEIARNLIGGVLEFDVSGCRKDGYDIENVRLTPVITHFEDDFNGIRLYLYGQYSDELAAKHWINCKTKFDMEYIDQTAKAAVDEKYLYLGRE
ncbi:MAG: CapA family protein [Oscillospiraceae bacterium]|nr:CapA family protein [Oscillospiraceae bacterium]